MRSLLGTVGVELYLTDLLADRDCFVDSDSVGSLSSKAGAGLRREEEYAGDERRPSLEVCSKVLSAGAQAQIWVKI